MYKIKAPIRYGVGRGAKGACWRLYKPADFPPQTADRTAAGRQAGRHIETTPPVNTTDQRLLIVQTSQKAL